MYIINRIEDIEIALQALVKTDPRLVAVIDGVGDIPLRRRPGGFRGLAEIVVSQQVSKASAKAIWSRLQNEVVPFDAGTFLVAGDGALKRAGLSRPKQKTLRGVAEAIVGGFDIQGCAKLESREAIARLTALYGIGPWTAAVYLMFCGGHPDLFPARDVALQSAVQRAFGLAKRPGEKELYALAEIWSPWRAVAARLFWAYYAAMGEGRDAAPL